MGNYYEAIRRKKPLRNPLLYVPPEEEADSQMAKFKINFGSPYKKRSRSGQTPLKGGAGHLNADLLDVEPDLDVDSHLKEMVRNYAVTGKDGETIDWKNDDDSEGEDDDVDAELPPASRKRARSWEGDGKEAASEDTTSDPSAMRYGEGSSSHWQQQHPVIRCIKRINHAAKGDDTIASEHRHSNGRAACGVAEEYIRLWLEVSLFLRSTPELKPPHLRRAQLAKLKSLLAPLAAALDGGVAPANYMRRNLVRSLYALARDLKQAGFYHIFSDILGREGGAHKHK
jgi:hypothetical protein